MITQLFYSLYVLVFGWVVYVHVCVRVSAYVCVCVHEDEVLMHICVHKGEEQRSIDFFLNLLLPSLLDVGSLTELKDHKFS